MNNDPVRFQFSLVLLDLLGPKYINKFQPSIYLDFFWWKNIFGPLDIHLPGNIQPSLSVLVTNRTYVLVWICQLNTIKTKQCAADKSGYMSAGCREEVGACVSARWVKMFAHLKLHSWKSKYAGPCLLTATWSETVCSLGVRRLVAGTQPCQFMCNCSQFIQPPPPLSALY